MKFCRASLVIPFLLLSLPAQAGETNSFNLVSMAGRTVGKAAYTVDKFKGGTRVRSSYTYRLMPEDLPSTKNVGPSTDSKGTLGQEAQMHAEYKVAGNGDLISGYTENQVNGLMTSYSTDREHRIEISSVQSGVQGLVNTVELPKPDFILLPLYDPAAIQVVISAMRQQNSATEDFLLAVPNHGNVSPIALKVEQLTEDTPIAGTLNGQPCPLRHLVFILGEAAGEQAAPKADVFTDENGNLMEADLRVFGIRYIRRAFALAAH